MVPGVTPPMSARLTNHTSTSEPPRVWMLLWAALAYVALTLHASIALASMAPAAPAITYTAWGDAATILHTLSPDPLAFCCGDQRCTIVVTAGALLPTAHEPIAKPRYQPRAVAFQYREPFPEAISWTSASAQSRRLPRHWR